MRDPRRFEIAAWFAFTELGMDPYPAAYLATFLLASGMRITTESVDGVLLQSSAGLSVTAKPRPYADWLRRKAPEALGRANDDERDWVTRSATLIAELVIFVPRLPETQLGVELTLDLLKKEGWAEPILRVANRIGASLRSDFPPAKDPLSRTAKRLLRELLEKKQRQ